MEAGRSATLVNTEGIQLPRSDGSSKSCLWKCVASVTLSDRFPTFAQIAMDRGGLLLDFDESLVNVPGCPHWFSFGDVSARCPSGRCSNPGGTALRLQKGWQLWEK